MNTSLIHHYRGELVEEGYWVVTVCFDVKITFWITTNYMMLYILKTRHGICHGCMDIVHVKSYLPGGKCKVCAEFHVYLKQTCFSQSYSTNILLTY